MAGQPTLLFGQGGGNAIYRVDATASDDAGVAFDIRARSDRLYPAGLGGEAVFTVLWLTVTTAITPAVPANTVELLITPYLDGVALETQSLTITGPTSGTQTRLTERFKFGLSVPYLDAYLAEQFRVGARGASLEVEVETYDGVMPGELIAIGMDVEYEIVRESLAAEALA